MKKLEILLTVSAATLCSLVIWYTFFQSDYDNEALAATPTTVRFEKDTLQLGTVKYGTKREALFRFVNTGTAPLLIRDVRPSCGCTSVKWSKHPVKPGETGEIRTIYDPNSLGKFQKNIEVHCNIPENAINLKICGSVIE